MYCVCALHFHLWATYFFITCFILVLQYLWQLPAEDEVLLQKLREESRAVFLQRKSRELLDNEELQVRENFTEHLGKHNDQFLFIVLKSCFGLACLSCNGIFFLMQCYPFCRIFGFCLINIKCHPRPAMRP